MTIEKQIILKADDNMVLTNGEAFGKVVYLGKNDSPENWQEITQAEAEYYKQNEVKNDD